jgi:carbonic anhydrase
MKTKFKFKGIHHCEAVVLSCIDFRFWRETLEFVENELGIKDFDFPALPGGAKAITECQVGDVAAKCIGVPIELHEAKKVVIINHEDCGAYGGSSQFAGDSAAEQIFHEKELEAAKEKLLKIHPDAVVIKVYAKLVDNKENIEFIVID